MNIYVIINFIIAFYCLIVVLKAYKKGFVYELLRLIFTFFSFFFAWLLAPVCAKYAPLVKSSDFSDVLLQLVTPYINIGIWFINILVILFGISLFILPFFKVFSRLPLFGFINRILGSFLGLINAFIILFVISMILALPFIPKGKNICNYTFLKPINNYGNKILVEVVKNFSFTSLDSETTKARRIFLEMLEKYSKHE